MANQLRTCSLKSEGLRLPNADPSFPPVVIPRSMSEREVDGFAELPFTGTYSGSLTIPPYQLLIPTQI